MSGIRNDLIYFINFKFCELVNLFKIYGIKIKINFLSQNKTKQTLPHTNITSFIL